MCSHIGPTGGSDFNQVVRRAGAPTRRTRQSPRVAKCRGRQIKSSTCVFNYVSNQRGGGGGAGAS